LEVLSTKTEGVKVKVLVESDAWGCVRDMNLGSNEGKGEEGSEEAGRFTIKERERAHNEKST